MLCAIPTWSFLYSLLYIHPGADKNKQSQNGKDHSSALVVERKENHHLPFSCFFFIFFFFLTAEDFLRWRENAREKKKVFDVKYLILAEKDVKVTEFVSLFFFFFTFVEINTKYKNWQWNFVLFVLFFFICGRSRSYISFSFFSATQLFDIWQISPPTRLCPAATELFSLQK